MAERTICRPDDPPTSGAAEEPGLPTPAESWQRNIEILDLVNQIREARRRRSEQGTDR